MKREDKISLIAFLSGLLVLISLELYLLKAFPELGLLIAGVSVLVGIISIIFIGSFLDAVWRKKDE